MRTVHITRLGRGDKFVCHGQVWSSLDKLVASLDQFFKPYELQMHDADTATDAFWNEQLRNGTAELRGAS